MSVDLTTANYVPTLFLRPAEVRAVRELPDFAKDKLCPIFCLKPWQGAKKLSAAMDKIHEVFGDRPYFLDVDYFKKTTDPDREANISFNGIKNSANGHEDWINFFAEYPQAYPCVIAHHGIEDAILSQVEGFTKQEKFFLVRLSKELGENFDAVVDLVCKTEHSNFGFVVDVGWRRDLIKNEDWAASLIKRITDIRGDSIPIVLTGSSFPDSFSHYKMGGQADLVERQLFDTIKSKNNVARLIYGDWASTRSPSEGGGGGEIPKRIDLSINAGWKIFRNHDTSGSYMAVAEHAVMDPSFEKSLNIWATYMLKATAIGDPNGINSTYLATAVRINLHLYNQLYFAEDTKPFDTDEDFVE